jgi:hypothetical protein
VSSLTSPPVPFLGLRIRTVDQLPSPRFAAMPTCHRVWVGSPDGLAQASRLWASSGISPAGGLMQGRARRTGG